MSITVNIYYTGEKGNNLLTELPKLLDENGNIEQSKLGPLMPHGQQAAVHFPQRRACV